MTCPWPGTWQGSAVIHCDVILTAERLAEAFCICTLAAAIVSSSAASLPLRMCRRRHSNSLGTTEFSDHRDWAACIVTLQALTLAISLITNQCQCRIKLALNSSLFLVLVTPSSCAPEVLDVGEGRVNSMRRLLIAWRWPCHEVYVHEIHSQRPHKALGMAGSSCKQQCSLSR